MIAFMTSASERIGKRDIAIASVLSVLGLLLMYERRERQRSGHGAVGRDPADRVRAPALPPGHGAAAVAACGADPRGRGFARAASCSTRCCSAPTCSAAESSCRRPFFFAFTAGAQLEGRDALIGLALADRVALRRLRRRLRSGHGRGLHERDRGRLGHRPPRPLARADGERAPGPHGRAARCTRRACAAGGRHVPGAPLTRARRAAPAPPRRACPHGRERHPSRACSRRGRDARRTSSTRAGARSRRCARSSASCATTPRRRPTAPQPTLTHLEALLVRAKGRDVRLTVEGSPRVLPAGGRAVGLPHRRAAAGRAGGRSRRRVRVGFGDDVLELAVSGPARRQAKAAFDRARERARLHRGTVDATIRGGRAEAVVSLPLLAVA